MKMVTKRGRWAIPVIAGVLIGGASQLGQMGYAAETTPAAKTDKPAKAPKPKSKTATGTITTASATQVKFTTPEGESTINLTPTTEFKRVQEGIKATDLKVGDTVRFPLKGTDGLPTIQSLTPLTLKFGDEATLTLNQTEKMKFDLVTKITAAELATGQEVKIASNVFADGKMEAREVWLVLPPVKAEKPETKPKA